MTETREAGPELDAEMAVEVRGWRQFTYDKPWPCGKPHVAWIAPEGRIINCRDWEPSTDWAAAGELLGIILRNNSSAFYSAIMYKCNIQEDTLGCYAVRRLLTGLTPLAICLAAREAVRGRES